MTLTTLAVHLEPAGAGALDDALALPLALAEAHGAHLAALVFPAGTEAAAGEEAALAHVRAVLARRGVAGEVQGRSSFAYGAGEVFADRMRVSDLGIVATSGPLHAGARMLVTQALFGSGRPLLLVPAGTPGFAAPSRVVVGWDATPAAVRATHAALPFIRAAAETLVVTVTEEKALRQGQSGIELAHLLARHGARATFLDIPRGDRGVAQALAGAAGGPQALLVAGACRHAPLHDLVFGSTTADLLGAGPALPTLLAA